MADLVSFPSGGGTTPLPRVSRVSPWPHSAPRTWRHFSRQSGTATPPRVPIDFERQLAAVKAMKFPEYIDYREISVPPTVAEYGMGIEMRLRATSFHTTPNVGAVPNAAHFTTKSEPSEMPSGWLLLYYSPRVNTVWNSQWRCIAQFRQPRVESREGDFTAKLYWDYAVEMLTDVAAGSVNGAVTMTKDHFFDTIASTSLSGSVLGCELRASWTPQQEGESACAINAPAQIHAWGSLMLKAGATNDSVERRRP